MPDPTATVEPLLCSAKGCLNPATRKIVWNNRKIHTPDREKIWLACDEHDAYLTDFLARRDFYRHTTDVVADD